MISQVSALFANHPDLLRDFSYFLPDAVQPQAEEQLAQYTQQAQRGQFAPQFDHHQRQQGGQYGHMHRHHMQHPQQHHGGDQNGMAMADRRGYPLQVRSARREDEIFLRLPNHERQFFLRVRAALGSRFVAWDDEERSCGRVCWCKTEHQRCGSGRADVFGVVIVGFSAPTCARRELWNEFIRCLELFAREVIDQSQLCTLLLVRRALLCIMLLSVRRSMALLYRAVLLPASRMCLASRTRRY